MQFYFLLFLLILSPPKSCLFVCLFILPPHTPWWVYLHQKEQKYFRFKRQTLEHWEGNSVSCCLPVFSSKDHVASPLLLPAFCSAVLCPFSPCCVVHTKLLTNCFGYKMYQPLSLWPLIFSIVIHSSTILVNLRQNSLMVAFMMICPSSLAFLQRLMGYLTFILDFEEFTMNIFIRH